MSEHLRHLPNLYEEGFPTEKLMKNDSSQIEGCSVSESKELIDIASYCFKANFFKASLTKKNPEILRRALLPYPNI